MAQACYFFKAVWERVSPKHLLWDTNWIQSHGKSIHWTKTSLEKTVYRTIRLSVIIYTRSCSLVRLYACLTV